MKIATWNVNSARARHDRIIDVLTRHDLDVLALQETKCKPDAWDTTSIEQMGYDVALHGLDQWNGVGIISRVGLDDVRREFDNQPRFNDKAEARAIAAVCGGVDVWSLYIPHGRALDDPHYRYKLAFLDALKDHVGSLLQREPNRKMLLVGDWNVAPLDSDVWDMAYFEDSTHVSQAERDAFAAFEQVGLREVTREFAPGYTYWDYRRLRFPKNEGMKIDFAYASTALAVTGAEIDRDERKGKGASDHVPVIVDIAD